MRNQFSELFLSKGINYTENDMPLRCALQFFKFIPDTDLINLGKYVSEEMIESADFIDHGSKPKLQTWSILGKRIDYVRISPDHEKALKKLLGFGVVSKSSSGAFPWLYHFITGYIISDSGLFCTLTLTAQTAYAISKYGDSFLKKQYFPSYIAGSEGWLGATYYSEIQGGSDLGNNTTIAVKNGSIWTLKGSDKYFASDAGLADGAIVTAKIKEGYGVRNIGLFFVPALNLNNEPNYEIRRLKEKLGTTAVPTGEVEFKDTIAFPLGELNQGIYYAMEVLTISRIDDALAACGIARKALWEAYLYANERTSFGKKIIEHTLLRRDFIELESELEGSLFLSLFAAMKFSNSCDEKPPYSDSYNLARLLSHISKNIAAETSTTLTRYSMEIFGGIGFFEEFPIAKFHRDAIVTSIWEGTSNIQALDMLEAILKKKVHLSLFQVLNDLLENIKNDKTKERVKESIEEMKKDLEQMLSKGNAELYSKDILNMMGHMVASTLMFCISYSTNNPEDMQSLLTMAEVYYQKNVLKNSKIPEELISSGGILKWMKKNNPKL